jgi:hypothetical protein
VPDDKVLSFYHVNSAFEFATLYLDPSQWENISITAMEVDFCGVKSSGFENSHATEVKCSTSPQKSYISYRKRSEMNVEAAENPKFSGHHSSFPSISDFLIKNFHNTDVVRG